VRRGRRRPTAVDRAEPDPRRGGTPAAPYRPGLGRRHRPTRTATAAAGQRGGRPGQPVDHDLGRYAMTWQSPHRLWLLLGVAALAVGYLIMQRRHSRYAVRFSNLRLLDRLAPQRPAWRRHLPAGLFLAMLAVLVLGFARPSAEVRVPR